MGGGWSKRGNAEGIGGGRGSRARERLYHSPHSKARNRRGYLGWWVRPNPSAPSAPWGGEGLRVDAPRPWGTPLPPAPALPPEHRGFPQEQLQRRHAGSPQGCFGSVAPLRRWGDPETGIPHGRGGDTGRAAGRAPSASRSQAGRGEPLRARPLLAPGGTGEQERLQPSLRTPRPRMGGYPASPATCPTVPPRRSPNLGCSHEKFGDTEWPPGAERGSPGTRGSPGSAERRRGGETPGGGRGTGASSHRARGWARGRSQGGPGGLRRGLRAHLPASAAAPGARRRAQPRGAVMGDGRTRSCGSPRPSRRANRGQEAGRETQPEPSKSQRWNRPPRREGLQLLTASGGEPCPCRRRRAALPGLGVSHRLGTARLGWARLGTARLRWARLRAARLGWARLGAAVRGGGVRCGSARPSTVRFGTARYGSVRHDPIRLSPARLSSERPGWVRARCHSTER